MDNQLQEKVSPPPISPTVTEHKEKKWGQIILGIVLLIFASGLGFMGLFALVLSNGSYGVIIVILSIAALLGGLGINFIFKGINLKIGTTEIVDEGKKKYFLKTLGYFILALLLVFISSYVSYWLTNKFLYHNEIQINFFSLLAGLFGWFIYYGLINKPWSVIKKVKWIVFVFVCLFLILPHIPYVLYNYSLTGKLPTPSEYKRVENENAYIKSLFLNDTDSFEISNQREVNIYDSDSNLKIYAAQIFTKDYGHRLDYSRIEITKTSNLTFTLAEEKSLFGYGIGMDGDIQEMDGNKVYISGKYITSVMWVSGDTFIDVKASGKIKPKSDEILGTLLEKYPSTWSGNI